MFDSGDLFYSGSYLDLRGRDGLLVPAHALRVALVRDGHGARGEGVAPVAVGSRLLRFYQLMMPLPEVGAAIVNNDDLVNVLLRLQHDTANVFSFIICR